MSLKVEPCAFPGLSRARYTSPHAAFADLGGDLIRAEPGADFERHELSGLI